LAQHTAAATGFSVRGDGKPVTQQILSFFRIARLPRISGGRWRYTRGEQTIGTSSVADRSAVMNDAGNLPRVL
jgi:hypothetical protein